MVLLSLVMAGCVLDPQAGKSPSPVHAYHMITFGDVSDVSTYFEPYRNRPNVNGVVNYADLYREFLSRTVDRWIAAMELCLSPDSTIEKRGASARLELHIIDDRFVVYDEGHSGAGPDGYLCEIDYVDLVLDGTTDYSLADFLSGLEGPEPSLVEVSFSSFIRISDYFNDSDYIGSSNPFSISGSLSISLGDSDATPRVSGSLDASFGSRIYSTVDDIDYAGKILSRIHLKPFSNIAFSDFIEAVGLLVETIEIGGDASTVENIEDIARTLWGNGASNYLTYTMLVGDNNGEIASRTHSDLDAFMVMLFVDDVNW